MICDPCTIPGHHPEMCRDFAVKPHGCTCQCQPAGTGLPKGTPDA